MAEPQGHCTAAQRPGEEQGDGVRGRNTSGHYCHQGQDVAELQPYVLLPAWLTLRAGLWESYLASLHLSTSISYVVKWSHQSLPNLVKIWAAHEVLSVNVCSIRYIAHACSYKHTCTYNSFPMDIFCVRNRLMARSEQDYFSGNIVQLLISLPELCCCTIWPPSTIASIENKGNWWAYG